jgi:DNA-binding NtrC family response regulator
MILADGPLLSLENMPFELESAQPSRARSIRASNLKQAVHLFERDYINEQLEKNHYHRGNTSKALGIGEATLYRKMNQLGIDLKEGGKLIRP